MVYGVRISREEHASKQGPAPQGSKRHFAATTPNCTASPPGTLISIAALILDGVSCLASCFRGLVSRKLLPAWHLTPPGSGHPYQAPHIPSRRKWRDTVPDPVKHWPLTPWVLLILNELRAGNSGVLAPHMISFGCSCNVQYGYSSIPELEL